MNARIQIVAQISNLLYRRIAFGKTSRLTVPVGHSTVSGLQIRDTAECNSALRCNFLAAHQ
jgi:hypothetical protein